ncbi:hypothetical protein [Flavobacterium sp. 245]|uniref:hypothetical protein n=1 Tax=Flavobacterium sp. 245 TaxID=2512115 RepID=UPI0010EA12C1|nr:hypothetical protein [Flavobacterium sp. 245]TDO94546.1 hypothetical protein EV145_11731 [Flavobacterium sp. 245]
MTLKTDDNIYVWEYIQDKIEVLNINDQAIQVDNTNPHQAANFASFSYKDNIIVMGGYLRTGNKGVKDLQVKFIFIILLLDIGMSLETFLLHEKPQEFLLMIKSI